MDTLVPIGVVAAGFTAVIGSLAWLAARARRRGVGTDVMGPIDEIFRPTAHRARFDIHAQNERMAPMPSPEDH